MFREEADRIWDKSVDAERELGALRMFEKGGVYQIDSVGIPDPNKANRMLLRNPTREDLGRHVSIGIPIHGAGESHLRATSDSGWAFRSSSSTVRTE